MGKKLTTQQFVDKAMNIHGNTYDYSKTIYQNAHTDVVIICPKHGEFLQEPTNHIHIKQGCPMCGKGGTDIERFWSLVSKDGKKIDYVEGNCWRWLGSLNHNGYGRFWVNNKTISASRFSYELHFEPVKEGFFVLHKCDNPECTNPQHLFVGTLKENMEDMSKKGRCRDQLGEKNNMAILTKKDVMEMRELYKTGNYTQKELAKKYGVALSTANQAINNKRWI